MDLFRFAYTIYPFIPATLLQEALFVAKLARLIDMRSSPYDVSAFEECGTPILVETAEGRKIFVAEQDHLYNLAQPVRFKLLENYNIFLERVQTVD